MPLIQRYVRRYCADPERDEVAGAVVVELTCHWRANKPVTTMFGLVGIMVRRQIARVRRRKRHLLLGEQDADVVGPTRSEPADAAAAFGATLCALRDSFRGPRQRWLFEQSLLGRTSMSMALEMGCEVKEVDDQIRDLCERLDRLGGA